MENMVDAASFWNGRRVLVTGAAGLVGSWLVSELISLNCRVVAFIHRPDPQSNLFRSGIYKRTSIVQNDLENFESVAGTISKFDIDTVFHLAAQPIVGVAYRSPLITFEANIRGTYNVLEACRMHKNLVSRVVVASSDKAYGTQDTLPYTEDMMLQGRHPYDVSKACADLLSQSYFHTYDLPVSIARCGNIYGGGDLNWSRIIPDTIRCGFRGVPLEIRSDGKFVRDYIYVKDVTTAYRRLAECIDDPRVKGQAFNFSPLQPISVLELVNKIQKLMGYESVEPLILNKAKGEIYSQYLDSSKAHKILGWQPRYTFDQGLLETIDWYKNYFSNDGTNRYD
jgi:CDP-glucose 4,6-dehydratase